MCSLGGDGTVRAVACALIGTETPLGILPAGTGNLLARNLDLPVDALDEAVRAALTGRNRRIDVGQLVIGELDAHGEPVDGGEPVTEHFLVMGGMGLDALIMGGTNEVLKQRVGWAAYLLAGAKHLVSPEFRTQLRLDSEPEFRHRKCLNGEPPRVWPISRSSARVKRSWLTLGVMTIAGIGSLTEAVLAGAHANAQLLLGGDVSAHLAYRPATEPTCGSRAGWAVPIRPPR